MLIKILISEWSFYTSKTLNKYLNIININSLIVGNIKEEDTNNKDILYLIPIPQIWNIPKNLKYITYQLEQCKQSKWINDEYLDKLKNSIYIFDYSQDNMLYFKNTDINKNFVDKINYMPIPLITKYKYNYDDCDIDILFYGGMNKRRFIILETLKKKYNLNIVMINKIFGKELNKYIKRSKIILNIHYYDNALLETTRLNECLTYNKIIISEKCSIDDHFNYNLYENLVIFCDMININVGLNLSDLFNNIQFYLNKENYNNYIEKRKPELEKLKEYCLDTFKKNISNIIN